MPSEKNRVNVVLDPTEYELVTRWAKVTETSRSAVIRDLLKQLAPNLSLVIDAIEDAKKAPYVALGKLEQAMSMVVADAAQAEIDLGEQTEQARLQLKEGRVRARRSVPKA